MKKYIRENTAAPAVATPAAPASTTTKAVDKALGANKATQTAFGKVDNVPKAKDAIMVTINNLKDVGNEEKIRALGLAIKDLKQLNESFNSVDHFIDYLFE